MQNTFSNLRSSCAHKCYPIFAKHGAAIAFAALVFVQPDQANASTFNSSCALPNGGSAGDQLSQNSSNDIVNFTGVLENSTFRVTTRRPSVGNNASGNRVVVTGTATVTPGGVTFGNTRSTATRSANFTANATGAAQFSFNLTGSGAPRRQIWTVTCTPPSVEIDVSSSENGAIADGGSDPQGIETIGLQKTITYTINNTGGRPLTLSGTPTASNPINISGPVAVSAPGTLSVPAFGNTTFTVTFTPAATGAFSFDLDILSDDTDEATYDIAVTGNANIAPSVVLSGPTVPQAGPFTVTATFSEAVSGFTLSDIAAGNGSVSNLALVSPGVYTFTFTPNDPSAQVSISIPANAANDGDNAPNTVSNTLVIAGGATTPAQEEEIRSVIIEETLRAIRRDIEFNRRAVRSARDRFGDSQRCRILEEELEENALSAIEFEEECDSNIVSRNHTPLTFDGFLKATDNEVSATGSFFEQIQIGDRRRLFFGEFDVSRYDAEDVTAQLNGRIAWETEVSDALLGYFVGANLSQSDIEGTVPGTRTGYGLSTGLYFVKQLENQIFFDGFATIGLGRNDLELSTGTAVIDGDYDTTSIAMGIAISGVREYEKFDLRPELSLGLAYVDISDAPLDVVVGGTPLASAIASSRVGYANIEFRPEFIFDPEQIAPVGLKGTWYDESTVVFAPHVSCEYIDTTSTDENCGGGIEMEWSASRNDGLQEFSAGIGFERIGDVDRASVNLMFEAEF